MQKPSVTCALLAAMVAKHRWRTPIGEDALLTIAAIQSHEYPTARDAFDRLRTQPYITDHGDNGIELDNGHFGRLAEVLYHECGWNAFQIKSRLKHYEGWNRHDWA